MKRVPKSVARRGRGDEASALVRLPMSQLLAMALRHPGALPPDPVNERGPYEVMLLERATERQVTFRTASFAGPHRVDLEDACELSGYDLVWVRRRRGSFGGEEAARCLGAIIEDLTWESGHDLQFWVIDGNRERLLAYREHDFEPLLRAGGAPLREALLAMLAFCGLAPKVEATGGRWLVLSMGPAVARGRLLVPLGARPIRSVPAKLRPGPGTMVLGRPQDRLPGAKRGAEAGVLPLGTLIRSLHLARVATIAKRWPKRSRVRGARRS
jgi:hypothetical protein